MQTHLPASSEVYNILSDEMTNILVNNSKDHTKPLPIC